MTPTMWILYFLALMTLCGHLAWEAADRGKMLPFCLSLWAVGVSAGCIGAILVTQGWVVLA